MTVAAVRQAKLSLGQAPPVPSIPLSAQAHQMFGPRGVCRLSDGGIWVADTGHHRLLRWPCISGPADAAGESAVQIFGQTHEDGESRNGGGEAGPCSFSTPVGLCAYGENGLALADSWNHRVLIWHQAPQQPGQAADVVLGQADFNSAESNRGEQQAAADSLFWPSAVYSDGQRLFVADTGNRRVLLWQELPTRNGQAADLVLGQADMQHRDQSAGADLDKRGMVWPHGVDIWQGDLVVADAGANRIMLWSGVPQQSGTPCEHVLGQADEFGRLHNQGHYKASRHSLAMPYALAVWGEYLVVADSANSRLLIWHKADLAQGAMAVHGQQDFVSAGDNRWQPVADDSLCWPYGLHVDADDLLIADTGNNRVQVWPLADLINGG